MKDRSMTCIVWSKWSNEKLSRMYRNCVEDKKFCSDGCRNAYNNKINKDSNNYMRNTNNKLRKIIVFYQNLILKENQNNLSQINKHLILNFSLIY
jgi:hypothetical protein